VRGGVTYDVAIVGCGPVGATLANLLGKRGLRVGVFEREESIYRLPRAVHFDGEIMRVFQSAGLADEVEQIVSGSAGSGVRFENEAGEVLLEVKPDATRMGPQGWLPHYQFHQPDLERVLRAGLERFENVDVHLGCEVTDVHDLEARYVVGCDGADSLVRRTIGASLENLGPAERWLVVDAIAAHDVPRTIVRYCWTSRPHMFIPIAPPRVRWELMLHEDEESGAAALALVDPDVEIERQAVYTFRSLLADRWRDGRLLIAGDAAHLQPPLEAQGLCSGIRDAANLAWKLALVCRARAREDLLDTYQSERAPHVRAWIERATAQAQVLQGAAPITRPPPAPRLGPGLHSHGALSQQPLLDDGTRLDDALGDGFAVLTAGRRAVVLRPDRYILGTADDEAELRELLATIPG
jgi:3-(3-hydroxy-phenyl)propionate hydroxylase